MTLPTEFAPAERLPKEEIIREYNKLLYSEIFNKQIFDKIPVIILVLNQLRQVVFANEYFKKVAKIENLKEVLGLRPGEIFSCIYSNISEGGCGTTKFCKYCGAVNAILSSSKGVSDIRECIITQREGNTVFFEVSASPIEILDNCYILFSLKDISDEKKRLYLEKQLLSRFFNSLSEIKIGSNLLMDTIKENELVETLDKKIRILLNEINFQKLILDAENFKLDVNPIKLNSLELFKEITEKFNHVNNRIIVKESSESIDFVSDYNLLFLVLKLGTQYALHGISDDKKISIYSKKDKNNIIMSIETPKFIPEDIQYKLFQKDYLANFKSSRIEAYLVHLITSMYLKGKITIVSEKENGTTFSLKLPLNLKKNLNLINGDKIESQN